MPRIDAVRIARCGVGEYFVQVTDARSGYDAVTGFDTGNLSWMAADYDPSDPPPFAFGRALGMAREIIGDESAPGAPLFEGIVNLCQGPHPDRRSCPGGCEPGLVAMTARAIATLNEDAGGSVGAGLALQSVEARARNLRRRWAWHTGGYVVEGAEGGASDSLALVTIFLEHRGNYSPPWSYWDDPSFPIRLAALLPADLYVETINPGVAYVCPA